MDKCGNSDKTMFSQTMDIDVDFDGNQSYQPTRMLSMFENQTFNFEDTEVTFEFTQYVQQLCNEMEEAKNRIDGTSNDSEAIKSLLSNIIEKVQKDMSLVNASINASSLNRTLLNNTTATAKINGNNTTVANNTTLLSSASKCETSLLGNLADIFCREDWHERDPIDKISKLCLVSKSLKELSNLSANLTLNTTAQDRSILKSIREEPVENKENSSANETFQENASMTAAEMTFINQSVCSPLMELLTAVEKKIDIEAIEESLKAKHEQQLKEKDAVISEKDDLIEKMKQEILELKEKHQKESQNTMEQLARAKHENEVLDEIISDEKRKIAEKQGTIEELNVRISENLNRIASVEATNIELKQEVNRLNLVEKENKSLSDQVDELMVKVNQVFELNKQIRFLNMDISEKKSQVETISLELKTSLEQGERLQKEKVDLMSRLELVMQEDSCKAAKISELQERAIQLNAQLSLQSDKFDFISAKLKDVTALKGQLENDRKDVCWQINDLLKNPDIDFDDLKTFLVRVEEKINNVDIKKPKGAAFVKSLAGNKEAGKV